MKKPLFPDATDIDADGLIERNMLVFRFGRERFAIYALDVKNVALWSPPVPLPTQSPIVDGVLEQDGRLIAVLSHPLAAPPKRVPKNLSLLIVCETTSGHIGIPATTSKAVGPMTFHFESVAEENIPSSEGPLSLIDPHLLANRIH